MLFEFTPQDLEKLATAVATRVIEKLKGSNFLIDGKLGLTEREAAALIGLNPWQLAVERKSGKIDHVRVVGRRVRYLGDHLFSYMEDNTSRGN